MKDEEKPKNEHAEKKQVTDWHTAFQSAMQLELRANKKDLIYHREYELTKKPMRIDFLVIRKNKGVRLENEIGRFFRTHNIMEYKSPGQPLNIDTLYKAFGYACVYKAETGMSVDEIPAGEVTVSLVREEKPRKLLEQLHRENHKITKKYPGIYYVEDMVFPLQLIVGQELTEKTHVCLRALTKHLTQEQMKDMMTESTTLCDKDDEQNFASVLEVMWKMRNRENGDEKGVNNMETNVVYEAFLKFFPEHERERKEQEEREEQLKQQLQQKEEQLKQQLQLKEEQIQQQEKHDRLCSICMIFENGGTDETAKKYLNATDEEIKKAHQYQAEQK